MKNKSQSFVPLACILFLAGLAGTVRAQTVTYTSLDHPAGAHGTYLYGVGGGKYVGVYYDSDLEPENWTGWG